MESDLSKMEKKCILIVTTSLLDVSEIGTAQGYSFVIRMSTDERFLSVNCDSTVRNTVENIQVVVIGFISVWESQLKPFIDATI